MCIVEVKKKIGLKLFVQPKASRTEIVGMHDGMIKVAVAAPPVDGKANKEIVSFFSSLFKIKKSKLTIASGDHSRRKVIVSDLFEKDMLQKKLSKYFE